ncbi:MAG: TIGR04283 family arsenosugar biosynthesis glycosyltransferase [Pseudohongiellaceae bacterium]
MNPLSIIIPVLNEAELLQRHLPSLQPLRSTGHQLIVVDGGSHDDSLRIAARQADMAVQTESGRAGQMNHGAGWADGEVLLFLHIDSVLPPGADQLILNALGDPDRVWGRFDVTFDAPGRVYRSIAALMNWRSRVTGVATGDQGIFVRTEVFRRNGGYADIPLMEDVELSKRLRRLSPPVCVRVPVTVSARRWQQHGLVKTVLLMWWLRLLYFLRIPPRFLVDRYYGS